MALIFMSRCVSTIDIPFIYHAPGQGSRSLWLPEVGTTIYMPLLFMNCLLGYSD